MNMNFLFLLLQTMHINKGCVHSRTSFKAHLGQTGDFFAEDGPQGGVISREEAQKFVDLQSAVVVKIVLPGYLLDRPVIRR